MRGYAAWEGSEMKRLLLASAVLAVTACGGSGTSAAPSPATPDVSSLTKVVLPAGDIHCPTGGISVNVNGGGVEYVCNGAVGPQGPTGPTGPQGPAGGGTGGGTGGGSTAAGSRLQIPAAQSVKHTGSDGSIYYTSSGGDLPFYDTALGVYCYPGLASDKTNRCIPTEDPRAPGKVVSAWLIGYADGACTIPAVAVSSVSCNPKYAVDYEYEYVCPNRLTINVYSLGSRLSNFFYKSDTSCVDYSTTLLPNGSAYLATLMAPSAFVAFTP